MAHARSKTAHGKVQNGQRLTVVHKSCHIVHYYTWSWPIGIWKKQQKTRLKRLWWLLTRRPGTLHQMSCRPTSVHLRYPQANIGWCMSAATVIVRLGALTGHPPQLDMGCRICFH